MLGCSISTKPICKTLWIPRWMATFLHLTTGDSKSPENQKETSSVRLSYKHHTRHRDLDRTHDQQQSTDTGVSHKLPYKSTQSSFDDLGCEQEHRTPKQQTQRITLAELLAWSVVQDTDAVLITLSSRMVTRHVVAHFRLSVCRQSTKDTIMPQQYLCQACA